MFNNFSNYDMHDHLSTAGMIMHNSIDAVLRKSQNILLNLNQFRQFQIEHQININVQTTFPCDTQDGQFKYLVNCRVFIQEEIYNSQQDQIRSYEQHVNLLNSLIYGLLGIDDTFVPNFVYFASSNTSFMYSYPYKNVPSSYNPKTRAWYTDHFKYLELDPTNNTQLTDVYEYYQEGVYAISMTQTMLTIDNQIEGLLASDIVFEIRFIENKKLDYMLVDAQGDLLLTNYKKYNINSSTQFHHFDDTNITGFNSFDWFCLFGYANQQQNDSICSIDGKSVLRRFNSVYGQEVALEIKKIEHANLYLIIFYSINVEAEVLYELIVLSQKIVQDYCINLMNYSLLGAMIVLILQAFIIRIIFSPIYFIIRSIIDLVSSKQKKYFEWKFSKDVKQLISVIEKEWEIKNQRKKQRQQRFDKGNKLQQLQNSFTSLYNRILENETVINPQCQVLQKFQYPKKGEISVLKLSEIVSNTLISNNQSEKQAQKYFDLKLIQKLLT